MHSSTRRIVGVTIAAAVASSLLLSTASAGAADFAKRAATATDKASIGLFGEQDPTFDGVYRQSLALIALDTANARVPQASVKWLLRQQCDSGRFPSFNDFADKTCGDEDGDSTALAVIALRRVGERAAARDAMDWLIAKQTRGGGWEFGTGFGANANTTGLVIQAMIAMNIDPSTVKTRHTGPYFLRSLQLGCSSDAVDDRGALAYLAEEPLAADNYATSQATQALAGASLPVSPATTENTLPEFSCAAKGAQPTPAAAAAGYLGRVIDANAGSVPGFSLSSTANAVLSLVAAGFGSDQIDAAMTTLETNAVDFTRDDSDAVVPAAAASLVLAAHATSGDPRSVGATNPVRDILQSRTLAG